MYSCGRSKPLEIIIHVGCWMLIFGFPLVLMEYATKWTNVDYLRHLRMPLAFGIVFYVNYLWLVPRLLLKQRDKIFRGWKFFLLYNFFLLGIVGVLLHVSSEFFFHNMANIHPHRPRPDGFMPPPRVMFLLRDIVMLGFVSALAVVIRMSREWQKAEEARREAENARTDAELKTLRNQLSPHFLLNTLNNIYALIAFDSEKAQLAVLELSKMLRHMLYDNQQKFVSLQSEADFVHNYVELMRLRLPREVVVDIDIQAHADRNTQIAPLIFISLIENAFKHGISSTEPSFVSITLKEEEDGIHGIIRNSNFPKNSSDKSGSGIGLEQVKRRLQLLYPKQYEWHYGPIEDEGRTYVSDLKIYFNKQINPNEYDTELCHY